jgi:hypothetical protein
MKTGLQDSTQVTQRVRVGVTGLAMVVVLIGVASAIFTSVNRERPVSAVGASNVSIVADMTDSNAAQPKSNEPLAEIGVAPSAPTNDPLANSAGTRRDAQPNGQH